MNRYRVYKDSTHKSHPWTVERISPGTSAAIMAHRTQDAAFRHAERMASIVPGFSPSWWVA